MKWISRYFLLSVLLVFAADMLTAQTPAQRGQHLVKRKETIFGIARQYGITIEELAKANPAMNNPGYELKKGDVLNIPFPTGGTAESGAKGGTAAAGTAAQTANPAPVSQAAKGKLRLGVMLPLHDVNGDGKRMVEYYRGVLMACDSLKKVGISVDVHAWNVPEEGDISATLKEKGAKDCDLIIGPLYSKQVKPLAEFAAQNNIKVLIPFSINSQEVLTNRQLFQVYQSQNDFNDAVVNRFIDRFKGHHVVIIDCNDSTSDKGSFTASLRRRLEVQGSQYSITNLKSSDQNFLKGFSTTQRNVVVLNTARSPELNAAIAKLNSLKLNTPNLNITLFGYTEWLMYTKFQLENFYKFDVYIPSAFYTNPLSSATERIQQKYRWNFHQDMQQALPRFAITGFDHAMFFLLGLHRNGADFNGMLGSVNYTPIQTPLRFERIGNGGLKNRSLLFVHYKPEHQVELISY